MRLKSAMLPMKNFGGRSRTRAPRTRIFSAVSPSQMLACLSGGKDAADLLYLDGYSLPDLRNSWVFLLRPPTEVDNQYRVTVLFGYSDAGIPWTWA